MITITKIPTRKTFYPYGDGHLEILLHFLLGIRSMPIWEDTKRQVSKSTWVLDNLDKWPHLQADHNMGLGQFLVDLQAFLAEQPSSFCCLIPGIQARDMRSTSSQGDILAALE